MTDQTETKTPEEELQESSSSGAPDIDTPDFAPEAVQDEQPADEEPTPERMTKDAFFSVFCGLWTAPNMALLMAGQKPLDALNVTPDDMAAKAASDALYDTIAEIPAMQWLLDPASEWIQRMFVIVSFAGPRIMGAVSEWQSRDQAPDGQSPLENREAANDEEPVAEPPSGPMVQPRPLD